MSRVLLRTAKVSQTASGFAAQDNMEPRVENVSDAALSQPSIKDTLKFDGCMKSFAIVLESLDACRKDESLIASRLLNSSTGHLALNLELLWEIQRKESLVRLVARGLDRHQVKMMSLATTSPSPSDLLNLNHDTQQERRIHLGRLSVMWMRIHCLHAILTDLSINQNDQLPRCQPSQRALNRYFNLSTTGYHRTTPCSYLSRLLTTRSCAAAYVGAAEDFIKIWKALPDYFLNQPQEALSVTALETLPDLQAQLHDLAQALNVTDTLSDPVQLVKSCALALIRQTLDWTTEAHHDTIAVIKKASLFKSHQILLPTASVPRPAPGNESEQQRALPNESEQQVASPPQDNAIPPHEGVPSELQTTSVETRNHTTTRSAVPSYPIELQRMNESSAQPVKDLATSSDRPSSVSATINPPLPHKTKLPSDRIPLQTHKDVDAVISHLSPTTVIRVEQSEQNYLDLDQSTQKKDLDRSSRNEDLEQSTQNMDLDQSQQNNSQHVQSQQNDHTDRRRASPQTLESRPNDNQFSPPVIDMHQSASTNAPADHGPTHSAQIIEKIVSQRSRQSTPSITDPHKKTNKSNDCQTIPDSALNSSIVPSCGRLNSPFTETRRPQKTKSTGDLPLAPAPQTHDPKVAVVHNSISRHMGESRPPASQERPSTAPQPSHKVDGPQNDSNIEPSIPPVPSVTNKPPPLFLTPECLRARGVGQLPSLETDQSSTQKENKSSDNDLRALPQTLNGSVPPSETQQLTHPAPGIEEQVAPKDHSETSCLADQHSIHPPLETPQASAREEQNVQSQSIPSQILSHDRNPDHTTQLSRYLALRDRPDLQTRLLPKPIRHSMGAHMINGSSTKSKDSVDETSKKRRRRSTDCGGQARKKRSQLDPIVEFENQSYTKKLSREFRRHPRLSVAFEEAKEMALRNETIIESDDNRSESIGDDDGSVIDDQSAELDPALVEKLRANAAQFGEQEQSHFAKLMVISKSKINE
ncbi:hypothetical protein KEM48_007115 [Puccinia striiformis f. sp. tritici PST-130]|uniref:Uncharacterized protein n=2 Tax=Puccinia striiformis f. sp. tritici TaxID=168172 RepID=A0A0L0VCM5_9BASI|nr:hypothetical protein H4Q26_007280 [Puccinia striiformis f. sp. tritici PST-130]KAI9622626.1 hypothetical protein KEM48_007115 [Puccinia striiformis f. sp. tritici PST-130]KNE97015.1 hypothetical protein PSTG_09751 [Puccinia striiformis f. sp. tritici PST-78]